MSQTPGSNLKLRQLNSKNMNASKRTTTTQGVSTQHLHTHSGMQSPIRSTPYMNQISQAVKSSSPVWLNELLLSEQPQNRPPVIN